MLTVLGPEALQAVGRAGLARPLALVRWPPPPPQSVAGPVQGRPRRRCQGELGAAFQEEQDHPSKLVSLTSIEIYFSTKA